MIHTPPCPTRGAFTGLPCANPHGDDDPPGCYTATTAQPQDPDNDTECKEDPR